MTVSFSLPSGVNNVLNNGTDSSVAFTRFALKLDACVSDRASVLALNVCSECVCVCMFQCYSQWLSQHALRREILSLVFCPLDHNLQQNTFRSSHRAFLHNKPLYLHSRCRHLAAVSSLEFRGKSLRSQICQTRCVCVS